MIPVKKNDFISGQRQDIILRPLHILRPHPVMHGDGIVTYELIDPYHAPHGGALGTGYGNGMPGAVGTKARRISILKCLVFDDVDAITSKYVDAQQLEVKSGNAISSDSDESIDGGIINRAMAYWDARLRRRLAFILADPNINVANDVLVGEEHFHYDFAFGERWDDSALEPLAMHIHEFLVWGCLHDWYLHVGKPQYQAYESRLDDLEKEIVSSLRAPSYAKRPVQPFGPIRPRRRRMF